MFKSKPEMESYSIINTVADLQYVAKALMTLDEFAFDTETNTLKVLGPNSAFKLVGISISWGSDDNYYIPVGHVRVEDVYHQLDLETVVEHLRPAFEREDVRIIGHNLKFDMHVMARVGIIIKTKDLFDTMVASWLCDENSPNGLKDNSAYYLKVDQTHFSEAIETIPNEVKKAFGLKASNKATFDMVLIEDAAPYALMDAYFTWELYMGFRTLLIKEKMDKVFYRVYAPFIRTLFTMEEHGVCVDIARLEEMSVSMKADMEKLEYEMYELAGVKFNAGSSQQLAELLFGYEKPDKANKNGKVTKAKVNQDIIACSFRFRLQGETKSGAPSTDSDTLWAISHLPTPKNKRKQEGILLCSKLLEYKKIAKLSSAFVDGLKEKLYDDGKAHPSFNIIGTDSGRLSCSNPNLQQLPKASDKDVYKIRTLFMGSRDFRTLRKRKKIVALDFSNLEMRVLAHFSEDKNLLEMFAHNADTHGSTAVNMFELKCDPSEVKAQYPHLRQAAKVINFLLMYGGGAMRLYESLKSDWYAPIDLGAPEYIDTYFPLIEKRSDISVIYPNGDGRNPPRVDRFTKKVRRNWDGHGEPTGVDVAQIYIDRYFKTYSGVAQFIKDQKRFAKKNLYVQTLLRRKRRLPSINSSNKKESSYCERLAVNSTIQGSAADITMSAQNRIAADPWFEENGVYMLLQIHDELVFECPAKLVDKCIEKARWYMEHPFGDDVSLNLPMKADADFGDTYQDAK